MLSKRLPHAFSQAEAVHCLTTRRSILIGYLVSFEPKDSTVVGHLKSFVANSQGLLTRARLYCGNTREPFAITMGNQKFYIITKPEDVSVVFRNSTTLTFEIFAQEILHDLGCSEPAIRGIPRVKSPARLTREFHVHHLFPGNLLNDIGAEFVKYYEKTLSIEYLTSQTKHVTRDAYFGKLLRKIQPDMAWILLEYDDLAWKVLFRYPPFLSRKMRAARDKVFKALEKYYASPADQRTDTVWFTLALEKEMRKVGVNDRDIAIMAMTIYWGVATNSRKGAFWFITYIIFNPDLMAIVHDEIAPAFMNAKVDQDYIANKCPRFRGAWEENLRMTAFSSSVRYITEDTIIGKKILRKGHRIMMPYRQMHLDESVFGERVEEFNSERFVKDPGLRRYNMAFGGGATQCPGRYLATQAIMVFVAMLIHRLQVTLDLPDQKFPDAEEAIPVLGIMDVKRSEDPSLRLQLRPISEE
ncbi:cytochrome P450 [Zopfia rhizophila CBS 207.26]|uniref:Cytochrome P450 n=1 Tax=Zopfia rhizophila CBS 207.26 TaxID=1314779 RepID=A0A6A6DID1_9PEZI|nr:cytochrome P450 [Zopfia rhizophila CBS 207.26]